MDPIILQNLFSLGTPIVKSLLKTKDVDLYKEIGTLDMLYNSLCFTINMIDDFYSRYLKEKSKTNILQHQEEFYKDFTQIRALTESSSFIFNQTYLGKLVATILKKLSSDLEVLLNSLVKGSKNHISFKELLEEGLLKEFEHTRQSIYINIGVLEMHKDHWQSLLSNEIKNNNSNSKHSALKLNIDTKHRS